MSNGKDTDRGPLGERAKDTDRGPLEAPAGAANVAADLFQRASQLGGLLVVAVVAPLGPAAGPGGLTSMQRALRGITPAEPEEPRTEAEPVAAARPRSMQERKAMLSGGD